MYSPRPRIDTLETTVRKTLLTMIMLGITLSMIYHLCYALLPNLFPGDWSLGIFTYRVSAESSRLPEAIIDVTIRDIIPISLILFSFILASTWIEKHYKLLPLAGYSGKTANLVNDLAVSNKVEISKSYVMITSKASAFVFGIRKVNLVLTSSAIDLLNEDKLKAVITHELSHILNKDVAVATWGQFYSFAIFSFFPLLCVYEVALTLWFNSPFWALFARLVFILILLLLVPLFLINSFCRVREFLADARASLLIGGSSEHLESALIDMQVERQMQNVHAKLPTYLSILSSDEFKGHLRNKLSPFISDHPHLLKRLGSLRRGEFIGRKKKAPDSEAAMWIGVSTCMFLGLIFELTSELTEGFYSAELWSLHGWWDIVSELRYYFWMFFAPLVISIYFVTYLRSYLKDLPTQSSNETDELYNLFLSLLKDSWKSLSYCFATFFIIYLPWIGYLGWWGLSFLTGGSIQKSAWNRQELPALPPSFENNIALVMLWPFMTIAFMLLFTLILGAVTQEMQKTIEKHKRSISKGFIEKEYPKELPFFDKIWDALSRASKTSEVEPKEMRAKVTGIVDPSIVNTLITPFVIAVVSTILSNFLTEIIKEEIKRRKKIGDALRKEIHVEVTKMANEFGINKDVALKIESYTIEYIESN